MLICTLLLLFILFHLTLLNYLNSHLLITYCWLFFFLQSSFLRAQYMKCNLYILWTLEYVCHICSLSSLNDLPLRLLHVQLILLYNRQIESHQGYHGSCGHDTLYEMLGFLFKYGVTHNWEWISKCYKRSLRYKMSFRQSRYMFETQAACKRCSLWRMLLDWLSWTYLDHAKFTEIVCTLYQGTHFLIKQLQHAALMTLPRCFA